MAVPVTVDVVSDVVCPWCFIGKRRLETAARRLSGEFELQVRWHPFQLDGTIPKGGIPRETYLLNKFGSKERVAALFDRVRDAGTEEGIAFAFDKIAVSPNTLDAHRLIDWAGDEGKQTAMKERLLRLYFLEGGNLADPAVLARAAGEIGLDEAAIAARLASDEGVAETEAQIAEAHRIGVTGVPFFIFGGRVAVPGAHGADVLEQAVRQAAAEA